MASFQFARRTQERIVRTEQLLEAFSAGGGRERWLFVSPHDDDLCLGAGLLMQAAPAAEVDVQVLIVTDGGLGYCTLRQQSDIAAIRREETYESFQALGIGRERIHRLEYPDGGLSPYLGRRPARRGEEGLAAEGYVGLQNAFTRELRRLRPNRVLVPTSADLHPDHRFTHSELMISLFHAGGAIWPELGKPLSAAPAVYELAVYCDFPEPPKIEITSDDAAFQRKLRAIEAYRSQTQIAVLVENTRRAGAVEYFRELAFRLYDPSACRPLFADSP